MKKLVLFCAFVCTALVVGAALHPKKSVASAMGVYLWGAANPNGGLDNPKFIENMHRVIMDRGNNVAWHCYFDVEAGGGHHQLSPGKDGNHQTIFPKSAEKFRELFGKQG